ncbi:60S ribosomal protein L29-like [Echinops telfairi]|uniref:60S ribosomal protein L29-like n=1 Tax=Echinops telfairi TaxID=9371 RepID=A0AC55CP68_ECHTE|nr:60S ribosomal protein L29-like [Echinops telfairi]
MAKSKTHTTPNQSQKWHRNGLKEPQSHPYEPLKGADPKFLRNVCLVKKHKKKDLKTLQAHNAKATDAHAEALMKPTEVKAKIPMAVNHKPGQLAYIAHAKLGKQSEALPASGSSSQRCPGSHKVEFAI